MKNKYLTKLLVMMMAIMLVVGSTACSQKKDTTVKKEDAKQQEEKSSKASKDQVVDEKKDVTIRFATNNPDQSAGMGMLEKKIADAYMSENPHVKIEFELNDNEVHRQKLKVYASSNKMPDIYMNWADPSALVPMVQGGFAAELNESDFDDYGFLPGSLGDASYKGKLYGLPRNFDIWFMMYNKKLFEDNGLEVPKTIEELKAVSEVFKSKGIAPCVMNGKDKWNEVVLLNDLMIRTHGNQDLVPNAFDGKTTFAAEESAIKAAELLKDLADNDFFQQGYLVADYNTAQNLFVQGKAAMYYIGSWELSMASREDFPEEFKQNVRAAFFPTFESTNDTYKEVIGRTGGIYSVNEGSKVKAEAIDFLKYMFKPENWAKLAWQEGVCTPAQSWDSYMTGNETELQKGVTSIFSEAKSTSGFMYAWRLTPSFEQDCLNNISELLVGNISPKEYWEIVDKSAEKNVLE